MAAPMPVYATLGANDLPRQVDFYEALLASIGIQKAFDSPKGGRFFGNPSTGLFAVIAPFDGQPATPGNGGMVSFAVASPAQVDAFHAKALELGATCDGPPGARGATSYFAYVRDLEGNKIAAHHWTRD